MHRQHSRTDPYVPRITLVTPYYWPEINSCVPLVDSLTEDLVEAGYEVTVLTCAPAPRDAGDGAGAPAAPRRERYRGATVRRLRNPFVRRPGAVAKLLEYAWFSAWIGARLLFSRRADACYVYSNPPLMGLLVALLARPRGTRVVYNLQDIFPDSGVVSGLIPAEGRAVRVLRRLERRTYAAVDLVAAISEDFAGHVRRVAPEARVEVIPNWIDTGSIRPVAPAENGFRRRAGVEGKFVVLYSGNLGYVHNLETLLEAAALLRDLPDVVFVIVGEGQQREAIRERARCEGLSNCLFFDFQPYSRIPEVYSAGDVCVVPMRRGGGVSSVPSKTWSIMACARPVVAAIDPESELTRVLAESGAGVAVEPEDPRALADAIRKLHADAALRESLGRSGRAYVERHLSRAGITRRYASAFAALVGGGASPSEAFRERAPRIGTTAPGRKAEQAR